MSPAHAALAADTPRGAPVASAAPASPAETTGIAWSADTLRSMDGSAQPVEVGRLAVPEDRAHPEGARIRVGFVRLRSTGASPGSPIIFLAGGPGVPGTAIARVPSYGKLFERLRRSGDVVLLDQRGCGLSEPSLLCFPKESLPRDALRDEEHAAAAMTRAVRSCAMALRRAGAHPEAYQTASAAGDVEDLRVALGAERVRLLAMSYGTEVALEVMRRHAAGVERAVLAGTRGPDDTWRMPDVLELQLRRLGALVSSDPEYAKTLPDFTLAVASLLDSLDAKPRSVSILDRRTGGKVTVEAGGFALRTALQLDLIDPRGFALLPATVATFERGDDSLFTKRVESVYNALSSTVPLLLIATDCASGGSAERVARARREAGRSPLRSARNLLLRPEICRAAGAADLGEAFRERIYSTVPTLFVSGSLDANTPAFEAEEVRWGFPNGLHLVVENGWHETLPSPEVQETVSDFLSGTNVAGRRIVLPPPRILSVEAAKALVESSR